MCKVPTLKQLAGEAIPKDVEEGRQDMSHDIAAIIEYNRSKVITCKHKTAWTLRRGEINGPVTYVCGCVEEWKDGKYVKDIADCDSSVCVWYRTWVEWGGGMWCKGSVII